MLTAHVVTARTAQLTYTSRRPLSLRSKLQWPRAAVGRLYCPSGIVHFDMLPKVSVVIFQSLHLLRMKWNTYFRFPTENYLFYRQLRVRSRGSPNLYPMETGTRAAGTWTWATVLQRVSMFCDLPWNFSKCLFCIIVTQMHFKFLFSL
jgi:hypothetical protein